LFCIFFFAFHPSKKATPGPDMSAPDVVWHGKTACCAQDDRNKRTGAGHRSCLDTIISHLWMEISQNPTQTLQLFLSYLERRLANNRRNNVRLDFLVRVSDAVFLRSKTLFLPYPSSWPRLPPLRTPPLLAHPPTPLPALSLRASALPRLHVPLAVIWFVFSTLNS